MRRVTAGVVAERLVWGVMVLATLAAGGWGMQTRDGWLMASAAFAAVIVGGMAHIVWDRGDSG